jgi:hypothetical protein
MFYGDAKYSAKCDEHALEEFWPSSWVSNYAKMKSGVYGVSRALWIKFKWIHYQLLTSGFPHPRDPPDNAVAAFERIQNIIDNGQKDVARNSGRWGGWKDD